LSRWAVGLVEHRQEAADRCGAEYVIDRLVRVDGVVIAAAGAGAGQVATSKLDLRVPTLDGSPAHQVTGNGSFMPPGASDSGKPGPHRDGCRGVEAGSRSSPT
jgi:hypothetical protein